MRFDTPSFFDYCYGIFVLDLNVNDDENNLRRRHTSITLVVRPSVSKT